jgi:zinc/manganese transport system permease protein
VTITASVQLVGVYLVFASLILPALAAYRMSSRMQLATGYLVGGLAYLIGLLLASLLDLPAGPLIVIALAGFSFFVLLIRRK